MLTWVSAGSLQPKSIPLSSVTRLVAGQSTAVFRRAALLDGSATLSFSLLYSCNGAGRSLDLVAQDAATFEVWFSSLRCLLDGRVVAPTPPGEVLCFGIHASFPLLCQGVDVAAVSFGSAHAAVLCRDGAVLTAGDGRSGQLGTGEAGPSGATGSVRRVTSLPAAARGVVCGGALSVACVHDDRVMAWGTPGWGGTAEWLPRCVGLPPEGAPYTLSCGPYHAAAVSSAGALWTWGEGAFGALGHGGVRSEATPRVVADLSAWHVTAVSCGVWHTAAVATRRDGGDARGRLFTWGDGDAGQLGASPPAAGGADVPRRRREPQVVPLLVGGELGALAVSAVACGARHTLALTDAGAVYACGKDGADGPAAPRGVFRRVMGPLAALRCECIAAGEMHSVAVAERRGGVFTWGSGAGGRLGHGDDKDVSEPRPIARLRGRDVSSLACGPRCTLIIAAHAQLGAERRAALARAADESAAMPRARSPSRTFLDFGATSRSSFREQRNPSLEQHALLSRTTSGVPIARDASPERSSGSLRSANTEIALLRARLAASAARIVELESARPTVAPAALLSKATQTERMPAPMGKAEVSVQTMNGDLPLAIAPPTNPLFAIPTSPRNGPSRSSLLAQQASEPPPSPAGAANGAVILNCHPGVSLSVGVDGVLRRVRFDRARFSEGCVLEIPGLPSFTLTLYASAACPAVLQKIGGIRTNEVFCTRTGFGCKTADNT